MRLRPVGDPRVRRRREARAFGESPIRRNSSRSCNGARRPCRHFLWGFDIFVTFRRFSHWHFRPLTSPENTTRLYEHARTRIDMHLCHMCKHGYNAWNDCPHAYPQRFTRWIRAVEKLWILWIKPVQTANLRHFHRNFLWITLWTLWMNNLFGCA